jgi:hypothetical protein
MPQGLDFALRASEENVTAPPVVVERLLPTLPNAG